MSRLLLVFCLVTAVLSPFGGAAREGDGRKRMAQSELTREFFVGAWEADVTEFGRRLRITWTLWENGRLAYHFQELPDGPIVRGSGGTWRLAGNEMHERWERPDGTSGAGRGTVERIDERTVRLTIVDNGHPEYTGLVRIYRRVGEPQLSMHPSESPNVSPRL
jgi:hypothetical protein